MVRIYILLFLIIVVSSCKKGDNSTHLLVFKNALDYPEIANITVETNQIETDAFECFMLGSIALIDDNNEIAYMGCDSHLNFIDVRSHELKRQFKLPYILADLYYHQATSSVIGITTIDENGKNHLISVNLKTGAINKNHFVDIDENSAFYVCSSILDNQGNYYVLRNDSSLLKYNIFDGRLQGNLTLPNVMYNAVYNEIDDELIGITNNGTIFQLMIIDLNKFEVKSTIDTEISIDSPIYLCAAGMDVKTGNYMMVEFLDEAKSTIVYIDSQTGLTTNTYDIDYTFDHFELL